MKPKSPSPGAGRADILEAALQEFADLGFRGASTSAIAKRARVTQPLVYHHFKSKQALWDAVVDGVFGELTGALLAASVGLQDDTRKRMEALLRAFIAFNGRRPELARLLRAEGHAGGPAFDSIYDRWVTGLVKFFRKELDAGIADGTLRKVDPRFAYFTIVGMVTHPFADRQTALRAFKLDFNRAADVDAYADFVVETVFRALGGDGTPKKKRR